MSNPIARYNLVIKQEATLRVAMTWRDSAGAILPLVGLDAWVHIRKTASSETILFSLTTDNERIVLADTSPNIILYISDEDTAEITTWTRGEYDFLIEFSNGERWRPFVGSVIVLPAVTRDVT